MIFYPHPFQTLVCNNWNAGRKLRGIRDCT